MRVYATLCAGILGLLVIFVLQVQHLASPAQADVTFFKYYNKDQVACLTQNIYHEARNQPIAGQLAVMYVTLNRVNDHRFPNTLCEVVKQGTHRPSWKNLKKLVPIKHRCQFSWYCDGKSDVIKDQATYDAISYLVDGILKGRIQVIDITDGATHYHADYVRPSWADTKTKTVEIEDHIFYRWEN